MAQFLPLIASVLPTVGSLVGNLVSKKQNPEVLGAVIAGLDANNQREYDKEMKALRAKYDEQTDQMMVLKNAISRLEDKPTNAELMEIIDEVEDEFGLGHETEEIVEQEKIVRDFLDEPKFSMSDFYEGKPTGRPIGFRARTVY